MDLTMYKQLGISNEVAAFGEEVLESLRERFDKIDETAEYNQYKVLSAMQQNRVNAACFNPTTGYGYDDQGRDTLERVYASCFNTEAALVRPQITCGTHALCVALAANLNGARFTGTRRLAMKESDRGAAMAEELLKCGVKLEIAENEIFVPKNQLHSPTEPIFGHNDHRIVMAMSVLLTRLGGVIRGAEAVAKSYPAFFEDIKRLGIEVKNDETE